MKKWIFYILLTCVASGICAASTMEGPTGLITVPTAESLRYKEYVIAYDYISSSKDSEYEEYFYKFHMGSFKGWEVGVVGGSTPTEGVFVNAKYYLMSDGSRYPISIAIGTKNLGSKSDTDVYMVASKRFKGGYMGHFGFNANFGTEKLNQSIIGGVEYLLTDYFSIIGDFSRGEDAYTVNGGVVLYLGEQFLVRASALDVTSEDENMLYTVGLSYTGFM